MTLTTKSRLAKRKLEIKEVRKENQKETSKKHDRKCLEFSERSTKDALLKQLQVLQDKLIQLEIEKKASKEIIDQLNAENCKQTYANKCLEEKIAKLENEMKSNSSQPNVVKTDTGDILMLCNECEYPAEDIYDLGEHMFEIHSSRFEGEGGACFVCDICNDGFITNLELNGHAQKHHSKPESTDSLQSDSRPCNFCDKNFAKHGDLMMHKKNKHGDKVALCWNFLTGNCTFGNDSCWFLHYESGGSYSTPEWKCNLCDDKFRCKSELQKHKKQKHEHFVQLCRNGENGKCIYGSEGCWFRHGNSEITEQNEVIEKVFGMLEKMTERILHRENYNLTK